MSGKLIKKVFSFFPIVAILFANTGLSVYKHYCGPYLAEISFFSSTAGCEMEDMETDCESSKKKKCCQDEHDFHHLDIDLRKESFAQISFELFSIQLENKVEEEFSLQQEIQETKPGRPPPASKRLPIYKRYNRLIYYG